MANFAEMLDQIKEKKQENKIVSEKLAVTTEEQLHNLANEVGWHSKVNSLTFYGIVAAIAFLYGLLFYGYFRLDDKISAQIKSQNDSMLSLQKDSFNMISSESKLLIQRSDEDRKKLYESLYTEKKDIQKKRAASHN